jgi:hypothetical protein
MRRSLCLVLLVTSCGGALSHWSSRTPVHGQDGEDDWWAIRCHRDDQGCLDQAGWACPDGYDIKDREARKYMLIKCKGRSGERVEVKD